MATSKVDSTLEEKIARIQRQNEGLKQRHLEVQADRETAKIQNAQMQRQPPSIDNLMPAERMAMMEKTDNSKNSTRFNNNRTSEEHLYNNRENRRGVSRRDQQNRNEHSSHEAEYFRRQKPENPGTSANNKRDRRFSEKPPPPDPSYSFLSDDQRDYPRTDSTPQFSRSREFVNRKNRDGTTEEDSKHLPVKGDNKKQNNSRQQQQQGSRNHPVSRDIKYTREWRVWKEEREKIDEARVNRQKTASGWRREWDNDKLLQNELPPNEDSETNHLTPLKVDISADGSRRVVRDISDHKDRHFSDEDSFVLDERKPLQHSDQNFGKGAATTMQGNSRCEPQYQGPRKPRGVWGRVPPNKGARNVNMPHSSAAADLSMEAMSIQLEVVDGMRYVNTVHSPPRDNLPVYTTMAEHTGHSPSRDNLPVYTTMAEHAGHSPTRDDIPAECNYSNMAEQIISQGDFHFPSETVINPSSDKMDHQPYTNPNIMQAACEVPETVVDKIPFKFDILDDCTRKEVFLEERTLPFGYIEPGEPYMVPSSFATYIQPVPPSYVVTTPQTLPSPQQPYIVTAPQTISPTHQQFVMTNPPYVYPQEQTAQPYGSTYQPTLIFNSPATQEVFNTNQPSSETFVNIQNIDFSRPPPNFVQKANEVQSVPTNSSSAYNPPNRNHEQRRPRAIVKNQNRTSTQSFKSSEQIPRHADKDQPRSQNFKSERQNKFFTSNQRGSYSFDPAHAENNKQNKSDQTDWRNKSSFQQDSKNQPSHQQWRKEGLRSQQNNFQRDQFKSPASFHAGTENQTQNVEKKEFTSEINNFSHFKPKPPRDFKLKSVGIKKEIEHSVVNESKDVGQPETFQSLTVERKEDIKDFNKDDDDDGNAFEDDGSWEEMSDEESEEENIPVEPVTISKLKPEENLFSKSLGEVVLEKSQSNPGTEKIVPEKSGTGIFRVEDVREKDKRIAREKKLEEEKNRSITENKLEEKCVENKSVQEYNPEVLKEKVPDDVDAITNEDTKLDVSCVNNVVDKSDEVFLPQNEDLSDQLKEKMDHLKVMEEEQQKLEEKHARLSEELNEEKLANEKKETELRMLQEELERKKSENNICEN